MSTTSPSPSSRRRRLRRQLAAAAVTALALTACGSDTDTDTDTASDAESVAVSLIVKTTTNPFFLAIAYLGDLPSITTAQERSQGYRTAMGRAGVAVDGELVVHDLHDERAAAAAVDRLLATEEPPTALFTSQNLVTIGAVRALRRRRAQHATALVGFDDFALADLLEPAVTVVAQDPTEIGRAAARRVFDRLAEPSLPATRIALPVRLLQRGSGEIRPEHPRAGSGPRTGGPA